MSTLTDVTRRQALLELLSTQDQFDQLRRHRMTLEGSPERHALIPKLAATYIQHKLLEMRATSLS